MQLQGQIELVRSDTGEVSSIGPGDAAFIPAMEFHSGYNFEQVTSVTLVCVPAEWETPGFMDIATRYPRSEIRILDGPFEFGGLKSHLRKLSSWPERDTTPPDPNRFQRLARPDWLSFIYGHRDSPLLMSIYHSSPALLAGSWRLGGGKVARPLRFLGETVIYAERSAIMINFDDRSLSPLWVEPGDSAFIPENTKFQLQNVQSSSAELWFFVAPWDGADVFTGDED